MSLIKCPECGKEISDKAKHCVHCGYPLEELKQCNDIQYKLSDTVCPICKSSEHILVDNCMDGCKLCGYIFTIVDEEVYQVHNRKKLQAIQALGPKCSKCGSTNVQWKNKRFVNGHIFKRFVCSNCGHHWR